MATIPQLPVWWQGDWGREALTCACNRRRLRHTYDPPHVYAICKHSSRSPSLNHNNRYTTSMLEDFLEFNPQGSNARGNKFAKNTFVYYYYIDTLLILYETVFPLFKFVILSPHRFCHTLKVGYLDIWKLYPVLFTKITTPNDCMHCNMYHVM